MTRCARCGGGVGGCTCTVNVDREQVARLGHHHADAERDRLRAALVEARGVVALCDMRPKHRIKDPEPDAVAAGMGLALGFGALMQSTSLAWRRYLGCNAGGEFTVGPCQTTVERALQRIDEALK